MKSLVFLMLAALVFVAKVYVNGESAEEETQYYEYYDEMETPSEVEVDAGGTYQATPVVNLTGLGFKKYTPTGAIGMVKTIKDSYSTVAHEVFECLTTKMVDALLKNANRPAKLSEPHSKRAPPTASTGSHINTKMVDLKAEIKALQDEVDKDSESFDPEEAEVLRKQFVKLNKEEVQNHQLKNVHPFVRKKYDLAVKKNKLQEMFSRDKEASKQYKKELSKRTKITTGPVCERIICGACKVVVEEFASLVNRSINNREVHYIEDVASSLCKTREVQLRYNRRVHDMCAYMTNQQQYKNLLVKPFEKEVDFDWDVDLDLSPSSIVGKTKEVCGSSGTGACLPEELNEIFPAVTEEQLTWPAECFVCRGVATALEEKLALYSSVTENIAFEIVGGICEKMTLDSGDREICKDLTSGGLGQEFAWQAFQHKELMNAKAKEGLSFPEKVCSSASLNQCDVWIDASKARMINEEKIMEAVYT